MSDQSAKTILLGVCLILFTTGIGIPIILNYSSLIKPYPYPGEVLSENCTMSCVTNLGCEYDGTIVIGYNYLNQSYVETVPVNEACEPDCCQSLIRDQGTVWLDLNQTHQIVTYDITRKSVANIFLVFAIILLLIDFGVLVIALIGCIQWLQRRHYTTI